MGGFFPVIGPGRQGMYDPETDERLDRPETPRMPPISVDWNQFAPTGTPAMTRFRQLMDTMPKREDYQPGKKTKILAALASSMVGLGQGGQSGIQNYEAITSRPYLEAMESFNREAQHAHQAAAQENAAQDNMRQFMESVNTENYRRNQFNQDVSEEEGRNFRHNQDVVSRGVNDILDNDTKKAEIAARGKHYKAMEGAAATQAGAARQNAETNARRQKFREEHPNSGRSGKPQYIGIQEQQRAKAQAFMEVAKDPQYGKYIKQSTRGKNTSFDIDLNAEDPGTIGSMFGRKPRLSPEDKQKILDEIKARIEKRTKELLNVKREDDSNDVTAPIIDDSDEYDN